MGPPGDRTRHSSTERTEDFSLAVDLSWHGMRQGESGVVTTEEKGEKDNTRSERHEAPDTERADLIKLASL